MIHGKSKTRLVGRAHEQRVLASALARARRGTVETVVLTGPPGVGLSALGSSIVAAAHADGLLAAQRHCAAASVRDATLLAGPIDDLIASDPSPGTRARLGALIEPHAIPAHHLLPSTRAWLPEPQARRRTLPDEAEVLLSCALQALCRAGAPSVIFLDGVDQASDEAIRRLCEVLAFPPIEGLLVVMAAHSDSEALEALRHNLRTQRFRRQELAVSGLGIDAIAEWTGQVADLDPVASLGLSRPIAEGSDCHPGTIAWILERATSTGVLDVDSAHSETALKALTARALGWQTAVSLRSSVTEALTTAALFEGDFSMALFATAAGVDPASAHEAVAAAVAARLLIPTGPGRYGFRRERTRSAFAVTDEARLARVGRRLHHAHWDQADFADRTCVVLILAAGVDALDAGERQALVKRAHELGRIAFRGGELTLANRTLQIARAAIDPSNPPSVAASIHHTLAEIARLQGRFDAMERSLARAAEFTRRPSDAFPAVLTRIGAAMEVRDYQAALAIHEEFLESIDRPLAPAGWIGAILMLGWVVWSLWRHPAEYHLSRPPPADPIDRMVLRTRMEIVAAEAVLRPREVPARVLQDLWRVIQRGTTGEAAFVWFGLGFIQMGISRLTQANRWVAVSRELARSRADASWWMRIEGYRALVFQPWVEGLAAAADTLEHLTAPWFTRGESGRPWVACGGGLVFRLLCGASPTDVARRARRIRRIARIRRVRVGLEVIDNLLAFCEAAADPDIEPRWDLASSLGVPELVDVCRMLLALQRGDNATSASMVVHANPDLAAGPPVAVLSQLYWLASLPVGIEAGTVTLWVQRRRARSALRQIARWAAAFEGRGYQETWARAAWAHARGNRARAKVLYSEALDGAETSGRLHDAIAIARISSTLSRKDGRSDEADSLQSRAEALHERWLGAASPSRATGADSSPELMRGAIEVAREVDRVPLISTTLACIQRATQCARVAVVLREGEIEEPVGELRAGETELAFTSLDDSDLPSDRIRDVLHGVPDATASPASQCIPITSGGPVLGAIYVVGWEATQEELESLEVLTTQLAVRLENLGLVSALEQKVHERTGQLQKALGRAEAASEAKGAFLARMSHELKTPLNAILGLADHLESDEGNPPSVVRRAGTIRTSGAHLLGVVRNVMDMASADAGRTVLYPTPTDLRGLVRACLEMVAEDARRKGLVLSATLSGETPTTAQLDASRVRQILINLLGNAVKFTDSGSVALSGRCINAEEQTLWILDITDTGVGIPSGLLERVFEPFEQLHTARRREGAGLGLAISSHFATEMGGRIEARSQAGSGSTFTVELPLVGAERTSGPWSFRREPRIEQLDGPVLRAMQTAASAGRLSAVRELAVNHLEGANQSHRSTLERIVGLTERFEEQDLVAFLERLEPS